MNNVSINYLRLGATIAFMMTGALLGFPALSQETAFTCSVEVQGEESKLTCLNENGTPASFHYQAALQNRIYLEYGLTLLGCAVPKIDGDLHDADDSIACVQNMFGLPPGELSRDDAHYISAAAGNSHSRERALDYLATRGYHLVNAHGALTEVPQLVGRVPLSFPALEEPPSGKRSVISDYRFYNFVYDAKNSFVQEVSLTNPAVFLRNFFKPVATLLDPSDAPQGGALNQAWQNILYEESRYARLFTDPVMTAIAEAPPVLRCIYDQYSAAPADDRDYLTSARSINLAFWSGAVPAAIGPEALRAFQVPESGLHPLLVIGPPVNACPETLGLALEVMATQFPGQVAATEVPASVDSEDAVLVVAEAGPELGYLPRSQRRYFTRIIEGDKSAGNSAANKIGIYIAFHRAYDATCHAEMTDDWEEYTFTRESDRLALREEEKIRLSPSEFEEFYLAASSLVPVVIAEYEEDPIKDFGSRDPNAAVPEVYAIRTQTDEENEAAFAEILAREGCRSELAGALRAALSEHLPQMTISEGESTVAIYFQGVTGARSMNVMLDAPYDPDSMQRSRVVSSSDAGLFPLGSDYGGRMLSYIARGDFGAARREHRKSADEAVRQIRAMGPSGFNPVADFYEWGFRTSDNFSPMNALITSYIIRRVQVLGSCGDRLIPISRTYIETETTRNGYGTEIMSREIGRYNEQVTVPAAFYHIVDQAEDITPGVYSRDLVDGAIEELSCASEMRKHLEANMIAFNSGGDPAWVSPENERLFSSSDQSVGTGESAYVYAGADATVMLIEEAAKGTDPRLSFLYDVPDDADRSPGELNLLLIDDMPAVVFDSSYFGLKPRERVPGRIVRLMMTCAENGELDVSQFLSSTQPNDLDPDATYVMTYSAYGMDGEWTLPVRLESQINGDEGFTFARFRGRMAVDESTFAGLRPTSNFISAVPMPNGNYHLDAGVDGGRVNTTLAPLLDHCRAIGTP
ncbi:MAG: hypothetical protein COA87_014620 [Halomonas sp.]|nr:hypothetical protein [Halomonas sp.]MBL1268954.1 hypothetical protein [Halomonas sp.]